MKVVYKLEGLCCANCSAKIEREIAKIDGVEEANIAFMTQKLTIVAPESEMDRIVAESERIAKKVEGDIRFSKIM